jgi:hypothetical protein
LIKITDQTFRQEDVGTLFYQSLTPLEIVPAYLCGMRPRVEPKAQMTPHNLFYGRNQRAHLKCP